MPTRRHVLGTIAALAAAPWLPAGCKLVPRNPGPAPGLVAPDFDLPSHVGRRFRLAELRRRGPVVVVFYRGFW